MKLAHVELNTQSTGSWEVGVCLVQVYQAVWASSKQFNCPTSLLGSSYRMIIFQEAGLVWEYLSAALTVHTYMCIYACMPRGRGDWCVMSVLESFQSLWIVYSQGKDLLCRMKSCTSLSKHPMSWWVSHQCGSLYLRGLVIQHLPKCFSSEMCERCFHVSSMSHTDSNIWKQNIP